MMVLTVGTMSFLSILSIIQRIHLHGPSNINPYLWMEALWTCLLRPNAVVVPVSRSGWTLTQVGYELKETYHPIKNENQSWPFHLSSWWKTEFLRYRSSSFLEKLSYCYNYKQTKLPTAPIGPFGIMQYSGNIKIPLWLENAVITFISI